MVFVKTMLFPRLFILEGSEKLVQVSVIDEFPTTMAVLNIPPFFSWERLSLVTTFNRRKLKASTELLLVSSPLHGKVLLYETRGMDCLEERTSITRSYVLWKCG